MTNKKKSKDNMICEDTPEKGKKTKKIEKINIYGYKCGDPKIGCMVDCINLTPWLTTQR